MRRTRALLGRWIRVLPLAGVALCGCASMSEADCRGSNWYALGERDALVFGLRPQIDQYAHQCASFGVTPDEREYLSGWSVGDRERAVRMLGGVCCNR